MLRKVRNMANELCFVINNIELRMEQILVEFDDIPIFYLCKGDGQLYLVLTKNMDGEEYLVVKISEHEVSDMLHGKVSMRQTIMEQKSYWDVKTGDEIVDDEVAEHDIADIPQEVLPYEDACYEVVSDDVKSYLQILDTRLAISATADEYKGAWRIIVEGYLTSIQNLTSAMQEAVADALSQADWLNEKKYKITFNFDYEEKEKLAVDENEVMNLAA